MLQQYLQSDVRSSKDANDILIFLEHRTKELIRDAVRTFENGEWIPVEDEPMLKDGTIIKKVILKDQNYLVYIHENGAKSHVIRSLESDDWYTEDLITILEAMC